MEEEPRDLQMSEENIRYGNGGVADFGNLSMGLDTIPDKEEDMPEYLRIAPSEIKIGRQIGRGGFGTVHEADWKGYKCAAKIVKTDNVRMIQKEVGLLSSLKHPNIVKCIGFSVDISADSRCMILLELMECDLRQLMNALLKKKANADLPFSERVATGILCQIVAGMAYLHENGIFHGDLKASNVLVSHDSRGRIHVKITDFGVSQQVKLEPGSRKQFTAKKRFRGIVGTRGWQAPEVSSSSSFFATSRFPMHVSTAAYRDPEYFRSEKPRRLRKSRPQEYYTAKADVYCFAITCYEVLSGGVPFESVPKSDIPKLVLAGERPKLPRGLSDDLVALIHRCWDGKPSRRPDFLELADYFIMRKTKDLVQPKCWGRLWRKSKAV